MSALYTKVKNIIKTKSVFENLDKPKNSKISCKSNFLLSIPYTNVELNYLNQASKNIPYSIEL